MKKITDPGELEGVDIDDIMRERRAMERLEAEIVLVLTPRHGERQIPRSTQTIAGLSGIYKTTYAKMNVILQGMVAKGFLYVPRSGGREKVYEVVSQEIVNEAARILGYVPDIPMITCEVCGNEYSSLLKGCAVCAKNESAYLLQAKAKDPKRTKSGKAINTKTITHVPGVGRKKTEDEKDSSTEKTKISEKRRKIFTGSKDILAYRKKTESAKQIDCDLEKGTELRLPDGGAIMHVDDEGPVYLPPEILKKAFGPPKKILEEDEGVAEIKHPDKEYFEEGEQKQLLAELQSGETVFARPHLRAKDLNAQSQRHREQKSEEAREFSEWCKTQEFTDIEQMALHLLVTDDGNYLVDEQFWPGRVMCLQNQNQTELSKLFKNNLKEDYVRAQLMDAAADIWGRYENVC